MCWSFVLSCDQACLRNKNTQSKSSPSRRLPPDTGQCGMALGSADLSQAGLLKPGGKLMLSRQ